MPHHETQTRSVTLMDLPWVRRLCENGIILDSELAYTRAAGGPQSAILSSVILPQRNLQTLISKCEKQAVVSQFRMKPDDQLAQIVTIAPGMHDETTDNTVWLHALDAMTVAAGKRGAHMLTGEIDEQSAMFATMRRAGFAVYARQEIWRREPGVAIPGDIIPADLTDETDADAMDIQLLYSNIVPRLVQPIAVPSSESEGLVYRQEGRVQGYIAVSEGKYGIYIMPFLHPDILFSEASAIIAGAIAQTAKAEKMPVYVCVRRYQDWLEDGLAELGFEPISQQAVMVRHIAAGVRQSIFAPIAHTLEVIPSAMRPPTSRVGDLSDLYQPGVDINLHGTSDNR
jgi:hypothetical protein